MDYTAIITTMPSRQKFLVRSLNSVLMQQLPPQEIIVICDMNGGRVLSGQSDDVSKYNGGMHSTLEELKSRTLDDLGGVLGGGLGGGFGSGKKPTVTSSSAGPLANVKFVANAGKGISSARNSGIAAATQEWLAFLDDDDEWLPSKMLQQSKVIVDANKQCRFDEQADEQRDEQQHNPKYLICHSNEKWLRNGKHIKQQAKHHKSGGELYYKSIQLCCISPSTVVMHRELFKEYGMFDEKLPVCEDYDMWLRITANEEVLFAEESLVIKHDGHHDQLSHLYWGMDRFRIYALQKMLCHENLLAEYRQATEASISHRLSILAEGARKRNKQRDFHYYSAIKDTLIYGISGRRSVRGVEQAAAGSAAAGSASGSAAGSAADSGAGSAMRQIYCPAVR